jgi:NAD(P)-dependent dehydrogenase (short-subunit alcohol dehydrogenase family)
MEKTALVTGGTRGIGYGIARALAGEGWQLVIGGVRPREAVAGVLGELEALGVRVSYAAGDIGTREGREALREAAHQATGGAGVNLLVNNAGVAPKVRADLLDTTEESYDYVVDRNLKGTFFLTQAIARGMVAARRGNPDFGAAIVNITSISVTVASINRGEYCVAKAGLGMLTQLFATRLGAEGIPVYEVRPGVIRTDMTSGVVGKYEQMTRDGLTVQPRMGLPEDVGRAVAALARGDFPYSTGAVFMVDGGLTVPRL